MNSYKDLSPSQIELLPSEEDILLYEKTGWYISPIVLPDELLEVAVGATHSFYKGEVDFRHPEIAGPANDVFDGKKALINNEFVSLQKKEIKNIVRHPMVAAIGAKLSRTKEIRLFADALMCKFPQKEKENSTFGWHRDKAYWPSCTSQNMLTAWIPLQDTTVDMGPMIVIENSHNWDLTGELKKYCAAGNKDLEGLKDYLERSKTDYKYIPMALKRGQLSFHHGDVFHASSVNSSDKNRISITIHLQDESNTFKQAYNDAGEKIRIGYERICREDENGNPDYRDPKIFPVLWDAKSENC